jgi:hypothetical protein
MCSWALIFPLPLSLENNPLGTNPTEAMILKVSVNAGCKWLTRVILATQEAEIRKISVKLSQLMRPYLKKTHHKTGLAEWLKW